MKRLIISVSAVLLAVLLATVTNVVLSVIVEKLDNKASVCIETVKNNNDVREKTSDLKNTWIKYKKIMSMFVDHSKLEEINLCVNETAISSGEEYIKLCEQLKLLVNELWEGEKFSFRNILSVL